MDVIQAFLLGIVQGVTEFLPISSSAHLIIASDIFGYQTHSVGLDVILHGATLCGVLVYFWKDLKKYFTSFLTNENLNEREYAYSLIIAFIPIVLIGLFAFKNIDVLRNTEIISSALILSSLALIVSDYTARHGYVKNVSIKCKGFGIGLFQVLAIIPGVSRSGITIAAGRSLGMSRREATKFSFLLSIPTIFASLLLVTFDWLEGGYVTESILSLVVGGLTAGIIAYFVVSIFIKTVERIGFLPFAIYQIILGLILISYTTVG